MPISFDCPACGKSYTTSDETAGKRARCKECGNTMTIPQPVVLDPYTFAEPARSYRPAADEDQVLPPRAGFPPQTKKAVGSGGSKTGLGGVVSVLAVVGIVVGRIALRLLFSHLGGRGQQPAQAPLPPPVVAVNADPKVPIDTKGPIALPPFPDPGPARPLAPGVEFHEIRLPGGSQPGFGGKLWLYLPSGEHPNKSLPCVLITAAGSNLLTGMALNDSDRPEHLPYVRAGFAVLAFELDGAAPDPQASTKFFTARAGLVNAHIALEYVLAKVAQVDPDRLYAAGHSSAGTLALTFAEHEPRLKGCIAFAPATELSGRPGFALFALQRPKLYDVLRRYWPKNNEAKLSCPVFLFHALDDSTVPVQGSIACAQRLRQLGKNVTLETVPAGNHYDSMIELGIPRAIAWLRAQSGQAGADAAPAPQPAVPVGPAPPPSSPPAAGGFPPAPGTGGFAPPPNGPRRGFRRPPSRRPSPTPF